MHRVGKQQVIKQLSFMTRNKDIDRFEFKNSASINQKVQVECLAEVTKRNIDRNSRTA